MIQKWTQNDLKMDPKLSKNGPKRSKNGPETIQKWTRNDPKMDPSNSKMDPNDPKNGQMIHFRKLEKKTHQDYITLL